MNYRGNKWFKCDLHIHTPESKCFKDVGVTPEMWVNECLEKGLNVVAVTDHNSGNYIDNIKKAAEGTGLIVFPGVEVTCDTSKIHLLVLFDKDKGSKEINEFLIYLGINSDEFAKQDAMTKEEYTVFKVAEEAIKRGALVIPAHVDEYNGLSELSNKSMNDFLNLEYIRGVQVVNKELFFHNQNSRETIKEALQKRYKDINDDLQKKWQNTVNKSLELEKSILTFSDNPSGPLESTHGLWGIGRRHTWIKMDENVSLESLRQALLMPDQRVKNDFNEISSPYQRPDYVLKGLKVKNTVLNKKDIELSFNPQLNTIIGGRGTGKSAINRIVRGIFSKNSELKEFEDLFSEQDDFFKLQEGEKGILTEDTKIEVYVERFNNEYKITYEQFKKNNQPLIKAEKFNKETEAFIEVDSEFINLFKLDIYSQKQIYNIATKPNALRDKIDQSIENFPTKMEELRAIENEYLEQSLNIRTLKEKINKKSKLNLELNDIKERILSFEAKGYSATLNNLKAATQDHGNLRKIHFDLQAKETLLQELINKFTYLDTSAFDFYPNHKDALITLIEENSKEFDGVISKLNEAQSLLADVKGNLASEIKKTQWYQDFTTYKNEYEALQTKLNADELAILENLEEQNKELSKKEKEIEEIEKAEGEFQDSENKLREIKKRYLLKRKEITTVRVEFLNDVLKDTKNIKIEIKPFRDEECFEQDLRKILQKDKFSDDIEKIVSMCFSGNVEKTLEVIKGDFYNVKYNASESLIYSKRFCKVITDLNDEQMDRLHLLYPEDKIEVKYKANKASSFKSISNASAGQKTSAVLTFLLSYGTTPLLLDQPEDDLDNQLIYDLIVDRLKNTKENRQIVVITHNANIPVNGDSELVIALNSETKDIEKLCEGSLENEVVKSEICNIMEGGEDAFLLRAKRYNIQR